MELGFEFDPDEMVNLAGRDISLRTAVKEYVAARPDGRPLLPIIVLRARDKTPREFDDSHMEALSKLPEFQSG
jgi:hypothetical protein